MEVLEDLPLPAEEMERNWKEGTSKEVPQETAVDGVDTKHSLGPEGTPEDRSGEGSVRTRTSEVVFLLGRANVGNLRHLVVEDSRTNETGNKSSEHLAVERDPRWNVCIMGQLEILGEVEGVRGRDVSVGLEKVHGIGVTGEPETTEQLSNDIEGDLYVCDSLDDATRYTEDGGEEDTIQSSSWGRSGGVNGDTHGTNTDGHTQYDKVSPFRNLFVRPH